MAVSGRDPGIDPWLSGLDHPNVLHVLSRRMLSLVAFLPDSRGTHENPISPDQISPFIQRRRFERGGCAFVNDRFATAYGGEPKARH